MNRQRINNSPPIKVLYIIKVVLLTNSYFFPYPLHFQAFQRAINKFDTPPRLPTV